MPTSIRVFLALACAFTAPAAVRFDESKADRIALSDARWRVEFAKSNGALVDIVDTARKSSLLAAPGKGCTWRVGAECDAAFRYAFDKRTGTLTLRYEMASPRIDAVVTVTPGEAGFDMRLALTNRSADVIEQVHFPAGLPLDAAKIEAAYIPFQLPGIKLRPAFFAAHRNWSNIYPGLFAFADFVQLDIAGGTFALYSVSEPAAIRPVQLGLRDQSRATPGRYTLEHIFQTAVAPGAAYTSPAVRIRVGDPVNGAIVAFRRDNGIDRYPGLRDKLGARLDKLAAAPLVKTDWKAAMRVPFREAIAQLDQLSAPVLIHTVAQQPGGHDSVAPDFIPPDAKWGTTADFRAFVDAARARGHLFMPYTNPTWWNENSPTLANLPAPLTMESLAVQRRPGKPAVESYGPNRGIAVSPTHPFVRARVDRMMKEWAEQVPSDFFFWDQVGARAWTRDFSPSAPSPLSYYDDWMDYVRRFADRGLMTEDGWDRLAQHMIGFCGSPYTGTRKFDFASQPYGYKGRADERFGAGTWDPYPLASFLFHDKVLFYHHDLEGQVSTAQTEVITWNLAFGFNMSYIWPAGAFTPSRAERVKLGNQLQREVVAKCTGVAMDEFTFIAPRVSRSRFGKVVVIANWQNDSPFDYKGARIVPGGYFVEIDGKRVAAATEPDTEKR